MTQNSTISIPVRTDVFVRLVHALKDRADMRDPVEAVHDAIEAWIATPPGQPKPVPRARPPAPPQSPKPPSRPWRDDIIDALRELGGRAPRLRVIEAVYRLRKARGDELPRTYEHIVQRTLQQYCPDSKVFDRNPEHAFFLWPEGAGAGMWALNEPVVARFLAWRDQPLEQLFASLGAPHGHA